jgi:hypothetical protein
MKQARVRQPRQPHLRLPGFGTSSAAVAANSVIDATITGVGSSSSSKKNTQQQDPVSQQLNQQLNQQLQLQRQFQQLQQQPAAARISPQNVSVLSCLFLSATAQTDDQHPTASPMKCIRRGLPLTDRRTDRHPAPRPLPQFGNARPCQQAPTGLVRGHSRSRTETG